MVLLSMRPNEKSPGAAVSSGAHTPAGLLCMPSTISRANFDLSLSASFRECSHCSLLLLEYGSSASWSLRAAIFPLCRTLCFGNLQPPGCTTVTLCFGNLQFPGWTTVAVTFGMRTATRGALAPTVR